MLSNQKKEFTYSRVKRVPYAEVAEEHYHFNHEIYYLCSGTRKFFINDKVYTASGGDLLMIPKGEIHKTTYFATDEEHERIAITFSDAMLQKLYMDISKEQVLKAFYGYHITVPEDKRAYLEDLFQKMADEYALYDEYSRTMISQEISELILFILRQQKVEHAEKKVDASEHVMEEAAQFIAMHFEEEITLEDISDKYHMSTSYFSRKFKSETGFRFKEYVNALRLKEARILLTESDMSITEIALKCGYENSNYFGDVFKKIEGVSPRDYRRMLFE